MQENKLYSFLKEIGLRPKPFEIYSACELWNDPYISQQLLGLHLDPDVEMVSRHPDFINRSVDWLNRQFNMSRHPSVLDLGCGPGLYANRLARLGAEVTGIDISQRSIDYAEQAACRENLSVTYICQNYLEYSSLQKFDLVLMIFCDFCSLSPEQQKVVFGKIRDFLTENGRFVLDVYSFNKFDNRNEYVGYEHITENGFWSEGEYFGFLHTFKYDDIKLILDKYTLIQGSRIQTFYNWLQYFSLESLKRVFEDNGFRLERYYADAAGAPYRKDSLEIAVVAQRK